VELPDRLGDTGHAEHRCFGARRRVRAGVRCRARPEPDRRVHDPAGPCTRSKGFLLMTTSLRRRAGVLATLAMLATSLFLITSPAGAQSIDNPATGGPHSVSTSNVSSFVSGFGGGTIYYPSSSGSYGGIAASPGYTASSSSLSWYGRRLASHGFVTIVIDTNSRFDQPNSRGTQLLRALDYITSSSAPTAVRSRVDGSRLAVSGHSMGGGGSLAASNSRSSLRASVPLTAWHTTKTWSSNTVPQMIIGAQRDSTASNSSHSSRFYNGLPNSTPKMFVSLRGAGHFAPNSTNSDISRMAVSWMKRWVDGNTAYNTYLCGAQRPTVGTTWDEVRDNCNTGWGSSTTPTTQPGGGGECVRSSNQTHVNNDRAVSVLGYAYARGSADFLGRTSYFVFSSLQQTGANEWTEVNSC
jgi:dienelactone hydrolase